MIDPLQIGNPKLPVLGVCFTTLAVIKSISVVDLWWFMARAVGIPLAFGNLTHWKNHRWFCSHVWCWNHAKATKFEGQKPEKTCHCPYTSRTKQIFSLNLNTFMVSPWFPYGFSCGFPMFDWAFPMVSRVKHISTSPRCAPSKTALQAFGMERVLWWAWTIQRPDAGERDGLGPWWLVKMLVMILSYTVITYDVVIMFDIFKMYAMMHHGVSLCTLWM